jgi:hypothetical protein
LLRGSSHVCDHAGALAAIGDPDPGAEPMHGASQSLAEFCTCEPIVNEQ